MCNCGFAKQMNSSGFYCERFRLYATERLNVCILTEIQKDWDARLQQVPPIIKAMVGMDCAVDCTDKDVKR